MRTAFLIILALVFLSALLLARAINSISTQELRRRVRAHKDKKTEAFYKLSSYGASAELFLRTVGVFSAAGLVVIAVQIAIWVGFLSVALLLWLTWSWRPLLGLNGFIFKLTSWTAIPAVRIVGFLHPVLSRFAISKTRQHTRLYEVEDVVGLLKRQARQVDNRISGDDLKIAISTLDFSGKKVSDVMTPRHKSVWVKSAEIIGPAVMDELHKTGHQRFPVVKDAPRSASPDVVGVLYLTDLLKHLDDKGHIRDIMHLGANFINESQNLQDAIDGFLKSGQYLLIVVNSFEEVVGTVTIEDVLRVLFGRTLTNEFDRYDDKRAVAAAEKQHTDDKTSDTGVE